MTDTSNQKPVNVFSVMKLLQLLTAKSVNVSILISIFCNLQLVSVFHAVVQTDPSVLMVMRNVFVQMGS